MGNFPLRILAANSMLTFMTENLPLQIVLYGLAAYVALNLLALLFSEQLIFAPQAPSYVHLPHEVKIESGGEIINAVYLEHSTAKYTLLFSHGNAEDLGNVFPFMEQFHALGYSVLMYDYRGYGTSEGTPSVRKTYQDIDAAYHWLVEEKQVDPGTIIVQGRSVGGGPSGWLAAHRPVGGLILESTFVSAFRVKTIVPLLPWDKFNTLQHLQQTTCPVLIMHGTHDEVIPFWHGQKLYDAAPGKKRHLWIEGAQHNNYAYVDGPRYIDSILAFIETLEK